MSWAALGHSPRGVRKERMQKSRQWRDGKFHNTEALYTSLWQALLGLFGSSRDKTPKTALPLIQGDRQRFAQPPASGLRITWLGHSTMIVEIDGHRFLTDPVFGPRTSPFAWIGPKRWYEPPIPLDQLPALDAILISHDHYDHLDEPSIRAMKDWNLPFITTLGVGAHLAGWGVPEERIIELDWWDTHKIGAITLTATPARHASGRHIFDKDRTLWCGFALHGPQHRVYYSGDTGLFNGLKTIGETLGPFDVTMIEAGAYHRAWPDWHIGPEQAITAHQWVRGKVFIPVHWGLFNLAYHAWTEPAERVLKAAENVGVRTLIPRPGESLEPTTAAPTARWWPDIPWETAEQSPVVSTKVRDR